MQFEISLDCNHENFLKIITDYENLSKFLPRQLTNVKIINQNENSTKIETTIQFKTLIKKPIIQSVEITQNHNELSFHVLDGHAKKTTSLIKIKPNNNSTIVSIDTDLKLSLAAKILTPIIKKEYKPLLQGVLMKMANEAENIG